MEKKNKSFHFILTGKGGVGKTTVSSFIAQYLVDYLHQDIMCIDTDQINASFHGFKSLNVEKLQLLENNEIVQRGWDVLIEKLYKTDKTNTIIDNGSGSFLPFLAYAFENELIQLLTTAESFQGIVYFHCIVTGGEGLGHTLSGMKQMIEQYKDTGVKFIIWLNPYHGKIEDKGIKFTSMREYIDYKKHIYTVLELPEYTSSTFGEDIADMLSKNRTFKDMLTSNSVSIASLNRYKKSQRDVFELVNQLPIF